MVFPSQFSNHRHKFHSIKERKPGSMTKVRNMIKFQGREKKKKKDEAWNSFHCFCLWNTVQIKPCLPVHRKCAAFQVRGWMEAWRLPSLGVIWQRGGVSGPLTFLGMAEGVPGPVRARKTGSLLSVAQGSWKFCGSIFSCCIFMNPLNNDHPENLW